MRSKDDDEDQEAEHHDLRDAFDAVMQAKAADAESAENGKCHENSHFCGRCQHGREDAADGFRRNARKSAGQEFPEIRKHPSGYCRVVHHEEQTAKDTEPAMNMPFLPGLFQFLIALDSAFAGCAADGKLHRHDGDAHQ